MTEYELRTDKQAERIGQCRKCLRPFHAGDLIITRSGHMKEKVYHLSCWNDMFVEV